MDKLKEILELIEESIDVDHIAYVTGELKKAMSHESVEAVPVKIAFPVEGYSFFSYEEIQKDMEKMLYNELVIILSSVILKDYGLPMIRANYGVGTFVSLFGLESFVEGSNMPWVRHLESTGDVKKLIGRGIPEMTGGLGGKLIETYQFYRETLKQYPKCEQAIRMYHPDLQGPLDNAHLILGSDIYLELYDNPERVKELLELISETYIQYVRLLKKTLNDEDGEFLHHWFTLYRGKVVLRNDSSVNISKEMYEEFSRPYEERICKGLGGAGFHYCGKDVGWFDSMMAIPGNTGLNIGRVPSFRYGCDFLYRVLEKLAGRKQYLANFHISSEELEHFDFDRFSTGFGLLYQTASLEEAKEFLYGYRSRF